MKKVDLNEGEVITIKSVDGKEYRFSDKGLFDMSLRDTRKAVVLKSFRSKEGADDYLTRMMKLRPSEFAGASVVKGLGDFDEVENKNPLKGAVSYIVVEKSVEDAEALANISPAAENTETGYDKPAHIAISDEEAGAAQASTTAGETDSAVTVDAEGISDGEVDSAEHRGDHNGTRKAEGATAEATTTQDFDADPDAAKLAARIANSSDTSPGTPAGSHKGVGDGVENTVFKSMVEAMQWQNPDPHRYHVVPTNFDDKKEYGKRYAFIVKTKPERKRVGSFGNKPVR